MLVLVQVVLALVQSALTLVQIALTLVQEVIALQFTANHSTLPGPVMKQRAPNGPKGAGTHIS